MSQHRLNPETQRQHRLNRELTLRLKKHDLGRCADLPVPICLAVLLGILRAWIPQCVDLLGILERWGPQCDDLLPVPICLAVLPGILERWIP